MSSGLVLVINCGSSSIKFALVDVSHGTFPLQGLAERLGTPEATIRWRAGEVEQSHDLPGASHQQALERVLPHLRQGQDGQPLIAVGHRVAHGGERFTGASPIDESARQAIAEASELAPLHNPANLLGIDTARALFPDLPHVAVFDTAFHQTLPPRAYRYALPADLYQTLRIRRYGFHGTSHRYVAALAARMLHKPVTDSQWISAHLGNGASTCAVRNGVSLDTSMGFTPLEGLVMGTRSGDVDPSLHAFLAHHLGWSPERIDRMLNHESGLLGLSGLSNDMRTLEQASAAGHEEATLAIDVFCYRLAKSIAAMACALERVDGILFTGGIGENSVRVREQTLSFLGWMGCRVDAAANARCVGGVAGAIHEASSIPVLVVPTNEEHQIALETFHSIVPDDQVTAAAHEEA